MVLGSDDAGIFQAGLAATPQLPSQITTATSNAIACRRLLKTPHLHLLMISIASGEKTVDSANSTLAFVSDIISAEAPAKHSRCVALLQLSDSVAVKAPRFW